ncbi:catalase [Kitasatospora sp. NPDC086009]|uniref:catalase n=1 Tax=unclassified Kitasatospora TaxID=2633591 RepID=UPI0037C54F18
MVARPGQPSAPIPTTVIGGGSSGTGGSSFGQCRAGLRVCGSAVRVPQPVGRPAGRRRSADEGVAGAAYLAVRGHHPVRVHAPVAAVSAVRGQFGAQRRAPCPSQRFRTPPTTPGPGCRATTTRSRLAGPDPDLHRQDLWEAVEGGDHPSWTLYVQAMPFDGAPGYRFRSARCWTTRSGTGWCPTSSAT